jgi:hypothetical protein
MTDHEFDQGLDQIQYLVARIEEMTDHPNFMPGIFGSPLMIPYPVAPREPLKWGPVRIFAASAAAVVSIGCFALVIVLSLFQSS